MKCQVAWNWRASRTELVVTTQKREHLVLAEAEWLSGEPCERLIPAFFEYSQVEAKRAVVRYDIMGTMKLSKLLKRRMLNDEQSARLLTGLAEAVHACTNASKVIDKVLFHPDFVYLDEAQNPNFIFVPFSGMAFDARLNSPFVMLAAMSDPKRMHWQTAEGEWQRDTVQKFVRAEKVFSANKYGRMLEELLHGRTDADAQDLVDERPARATTVDSGPAAMFMSDLFTADVVPASSAQTFAIRRDDTGELLALPGLGRVATMGSSPRCDLVVRDNPFMQDEHLRIRVEDTCVCIEDCDSSHGTYAFNRRLAPHTPTRLYEDDRFLIGGEPFCVCVQGSAHAAR